MKTQEEYRAGIRAWWACGIACAGFWMAVAWRLWQWLRW